MRNLTRVFQLMVPLIIALALILLVAPRDLGHAQSFGVTVTPDRERINVRIAPAIGREVIGSLLRGQEVDATGRNGTGQWLRINYFGQEGWVEKSVIIINGNPDVLPLGDPPIAPLDLGDGPRAGPSNAYGAGEVRLPESGIRLRAGPSEAYFMVANIPRYEIVSVTGRSTDGQWLQVQYRGMLGWIKNLGLPFVEWRLGAVEFMPEWGVVADGPPANIPETNPSASRDALMTAMLLHIERSTPTVDIMADVWNTIARGQGGNNLCVFGVNIVQPYIPLSGDLIEYPELDSVIAALNEGTNETNTAIMHWEQWCDLLLQNYPGGDALVEPALENVRNARQGFEGAEAQIFGLGLEPTPVPAPPEFTPAAPIPTVTPPFYQVTDLQAFGLEGSRVLYVEQFTHPELGCNWQGLGGQVKGMYGEPLIGFTIRVEGVTDPSLVQETVSGANTAYGESGWEIKVTDGPNTHVYRVTLYQNDRRVSDPRDVTFVNDCARNLGIMNFNQLTPLE